MYLLGHGTHHEVIDDFFTNGLEMINGEKGNYDDLGSVAVGLDLNDYESTVEMLSHWPHRESPNVVLLAVSSPGDELNELQQHFYFDGMIQRSGRTGLVWGQEEEISHIPPDWVLGVYSSTSGLVTMNPTFSGKRILPADFEKSEGGRYRRHLAQAAIVAKYGVSGLLPGGMDPDKKIDVPLEDREPYSIEDLPTDLGDGWVW